MLQYGGEKEWNSAGVKKITAQEEKRIDTDGLAYTKADFIECYGGTVEWDAAAVHEELPQRTRTRRRR